LDDTPPICRTTAECDARDGQRIAVVGTYRHFPDQPGIDYTDVPRAVRIELADGRGPVLEPYWSPGAGRPEAEIRQHLGRRVRVVGRYHRLMPRNPVDPPYASAVGGPCIEVESIEAAP
jgi:hypothetical protein